MDDITARDLVSKRLFGYLRWKLHRSAEHGSGVLSALQSDLTQTKPDHIAVTGDLTHLGLSAEYQEGPAVAAETGIAISGYRHSRQPRCVCQDSSGIRPWPTGPIT